MGPGSKIGGGARLPVSTATPVDAVDKFQAEVEAPAPKLQVPLGPRQGGMVRAEKVGEPEVPRRLAHMIKKLEQSGDFGAGFMHGAASAEAELHEVVDRVPDLFQSSRHAQLDKAVGRLVDLLSSRHKDALSAELQRQLGPRVAHELALTKDNPKECAGVLLGVLAASNVLGKRTRLSTVANRLEDIAKRVVSEAPPQSKKPRLRERAPPRKIGTEGQGALAGKQLRTDGRISGRRFVGAYRESELARAAALGIKVDMASDDFLSALGANAGFDSRTGTIRLRKDATALEWFHEMTHAEQFVELGPEAYNQQSRMDKELHVFRAIQTHSADFNPYEYEAARNYIIRLAEQAELPLPEEVR